MVVSYPQAPEPAVVREQYDWTGISPASAVVRTVSQALDCSPTSFGPLYEEIDPEALNSVVAPTDPTEASGSTVVSFRFGPHEVAVHGNGDVIVRVNAPVEA